MIFKQTLQFYKFRNKKWYALILKPFLCVLGTPFLIVATPFVYLLTKLKEVYLKGYYKFLSLFERLTSKNIKAPDTPSTYLKKMPRQVFLDHFFVFCLFLLLCILLPIVLGGFCLYVVFNVLWYFGLLIVAAFEKKAVLIELDLDEDIKKTTEEEQKQLLLAKNISDVMTQKEIDEHLNQKKVKGESEPN